MENNFAKDFTQCPNCGSEQRFFEELGKEIKARGLASENWKQVYDVQQGVVMDKTKDSLIPIGSEVPAFLVTTDICLDCGMVYAIRLERHSAKKGVGIPGNVGRMPPGANNPRLS